MDKNVGGRGLKRTIILPTIKTKTMFTIMFGVTILILHTGPVEHCNKGIRQWANRRSRKY